MADHILVATDLSKRSELAVKRAMDLGELWNASVSILHVVDEDQPSEIIRQKMSSAQTYLEQHPAKKGTGFSETEILVRAGEIHDVINGTAKEKGSKIIIMGAHRRNIILDVFRGTTIERVLHTGTVPVLMAIRDVEDGYDTALFGVDMAEYSQYAVRKAYDFGLVNSARLTVVHAYSDMVKTQLNFVGINQDEIKKHNAQEDSRNSDRVYNHLSDTPLADQNYRLVLEDTDPSQLILKVAGDLDADLIVIGTRSSRGIRKVILGSVAEQVLRHAHCDVLVVPPRIK
jgi:nucleotide-binding universal stress UspA family protein